MLIRVRSTGAVMYESEFRTYMAQTTGASWDQTTNEILNELGADPVLNGQQPTPSFYQTVSQQGAEQVNDQWFTKFVLVDMDQEAKDAKDAQCKASNKSQAESLLAATDWTATIDIANVQYTSPYLANQADFLLYRSLVRGIALNPPVEATFPDKPTEQWSS